MPSFFSRAATVAAPLICTGDPTLVRLQIDGYRAAFQHLIRVETIQNGFRWVFRALPGLADQLRDLAEREAACCRFLSFELTSDGNEIIWETTGDPSAREVVEEFARLPQRLRDEPRAGDDVAALKRKAEAAGLAFTEMDGTGAGGRD